MKKFILPLALTLALASTGYAEDIQTEAIDSLSTARTFVEKGKYNKAIEEINYALAKINELTASGLIKFIPDPPSGFTLDNKQSQGSGTGASIAGSAGASAAYSDAKGSHLNLNIAIGGITGKMGSLAALGQMFAGMAQQQGGGGGEQTRQIRVKGYTGTEIFNNQNRSGTLSFQVGDKTSVTIEGTDIDSPDILKQLAKNMDFASLEENY
ncbi:MAG: hypothetical protein JRC87_05555 [Deltaproteobacteria bacterium]|nr:hypothetical protein [Deltaproteobacteria bacterium]MBW2659055.1 hypothetical protein [Deltaproteobacteria bacterium]